MKIKIGISLFLVLFVMPIAYGSYVGFSPPKVRVEGPYNYDQREKDRRFNYKPYSGARSDAELVRYNVETQQSIQNMADDFEKSAKKYNNSVKAVDEAVNAFDRMITSRF